MGDDAVAPQDNVVINIYGKLKQEQGGTFEALQDKDKLWKEFANTSYFQMVKDYVESLCEKLDDLEGNAFESGASNEEIVMRRAVARLTKVNLRSLIARADGTK